MIELVCIAAGMVIADRLIRRSGFSAGRDEYQAWMLRGAIIGGLAGPLVVLLSISFTTPIISDAQSVVRREYVRGVGLSYERYTTGYETVYFGHVQRNRKWEIWQVPNSKLTALYIDVPTERDQYVVCRSTYRTLRPALWWERVAYFPQVWLRSSAISRQINSVELHLCDVPDATGKQSN